MKNIVSTYFCMALLLASTITLASDTPSNREANTPAPTALTQSFTEQYNFLAKSLVDYPEALEALNTALKPLYNANGSIEEYQEAIRTIKSLPKNQAFADVPVSGFIMGLLKPTPITKHLRALIETLTESVSVINTLRSTSPQEQLLANNKRLKQLARTNRFFKYLLPTLLATAAGATGYKYFSVKRKMKRIEALLSLSSAYKYNQLTTSMSTGAYATKLKAIIGESNDDALIVDPFHMTNMDYLIKDFFSEKSPKKKKVSAWITECQPQISTGTAGQHQDVYPSPDVNLGYYPSVSYTTTHESKGPNSFHGTV